MKIEIPLKGGFNSHYDPEEVGSGLTELINFNNKKDGKIIKRLALGVGILFRYKNLTNIIHWISPNGDDYYIAYDIRSQQNTLNRQIYKISNNFTDIEEIAKLQGVGDEVKFENNGSMVRISFGHNHLSRIYHYIKRSLLWGSYKQFYNGRYFFDFAHPRNIINEYLLSSSLSSIKNTSSENLQFSLKMFSDECKTLDLSVENTTYYYSYSLLFDGVQESLLTPTSFNTKGLAESNTAMEGILKFDNTNWNPRVTGINIYRGLSSNLSSHYKILSRSLTDTDDSINYKNSIDGNTGMIYYAEGANFDEDSLIGKKLIIHMGTNSNTDLYQDRDIRGNTKDCIYVDQGTTGLPGDGNGAIWGQYAYIAGDLQYDDVEHQIGGTGEVLKWYTTTVGGASISDQAVGTWAGHYTYLGAGTVGSSAKGIMLGESQDFSSERIWVTSHKIRTDIFDDMGGTPTYPREYKLSMMVGVETSKLNAHMDDPNVDFIEVMVGATDHSEPTASSISDSYQIGNTLTQLDFKAVRPQYKTGTWEGSTTESSASDTPPGNDTLDYLNPAFTINWVNVTGTFKAESATQYLFIKVTKRSSNISTDCMLYVDNLVIAKTLEVYKMYGGEQVYTSPTLDLDSDSGHKDWAYIGSGSVHPNLNGISVVEHMTPEAEIGHIHNNSKRSIFKDKFSGQYSYTEDLSTHYNLFNEVSIDDAVFSESDNSLYKNNLVNPSLGDNKRRYWIIGNKVRISGTVHNNGFFTIKMLEDAGAGSPSKIYFEDDRMVINETIDNGNARIFPSGTIHISNNFQIRARNNETSLVFWDKGLADGEYHPLPHTSSIEVGYKYVTSANGRRFVANVNLNPKGKNEVHKDWIIFSELGQPDVLPISNYIYLQDLQGGEIHGIETLLSDIVVFMDNGIFRVRVPTSDPKQWRTIEAIRDVGSSAPDSIVTYDGGVFFAGKDNYYYLNANFELTPISSSIKSEYQHFYHNGIKTIKDVQSNRLIVQISNNNFFIFDLDSFAINEENWSKYILSIHEGSSEYMIQDLNNIVWIVKNSSDETKIKEFTSPIDYEVTPVNISCGVGTGWIPITSNYNRDKMIRRIHIRYKTNSQSVSIDLLKNEEDSVIWTRKLDPSKSLDSLKVGVRAKNIKLRLSDNSKDSVEIRRIEIETD